MDATIFSQQRFIDAIVRTGAWPGRAVKIQSERTPAHVFALESPRRFGRRTIALAPLGLYSYPIGDDALCSAVPEIVAQLKSIRTVNFHWNVRFDHPELAEMLAQFDLDRTEHMTQVLFLKDRYDEIFKRFSATARNLVRQSERLGVVVEARHGSDAVEQYYAIYDKLISQRPDWNRRFPKALFHELVNLRDDVIFLAAAVNDTPVAGGWFFRDGNSLFYWQGAMDYAFKRFSPQYAVVNAGIEMACAEGMHTFHMGGSPRASQESFKAAWGAVKVPVWRFHWENPLWSSIARTGKKIGKW